MPQPCYIILQTALPGRLATTSGQNSRLAKSLSPELQSRHLKINIRKVAAMPWPATTRIKASAMFKKVYIALLTVAALGACSQDEIPIQDPMNTPATRPIAVTAITLEPQNFIPHIAVVGSIQAAEEIVLSAELIAPVKKIHVREGQNVKRGDLLLSLDSEKVELNLTRARESLQRAQSRLQESDDNFTRRKELAEQKTLSQELLDAAHHEWQRAKSAVAEAEAATSLAQRKLTDSRIISPVNGVIDQNLVEVGEAVQEGQDLLLIQATDHLEVKTYVSERDIHFIREGNKAQVTVSNWPYQTFAASVSTVGIAGDGRTGNFPVTLLIDPIANSSAVTLRPGMTATVRIQGETSQSKLLIPETTLVDYQRERVVFVIEDQKAALRRPQLQVGLGDQVKIISGLQQGERVIVSASRPLRDGATVVERTIDKIDEQTTELEAE